MLALAVSRLHSGAGFDGVIWPAAGILFAGILRAWLDAWSLDQMHKSARAHLSQWRADAIAAVASRSPLDRTRAHAGAAASAIAEQAEAILPWQTRYRGAEWRVRFVPVLILLPVAWYSWAAATVLLLAAPLIPLFMAIIGWRAQAASEAQWVQMGSMNAFLLDRLRGLPTLCVLGSVEATARRVRSSAEDLRMRTMRVLRIAFLSSAVLELFAALGVALVAAYVGFHLLGHLDFGSWGRRLSLSEGLFVLLLAPSFFEPLRELASVWHDKASGVAAKSALNRLTAGGLPLLDNTPPDESAPANYLTKEDLHTQQRPPRVKVHNLTFAFPGEDAIFRDFSLEVKPGEHIALMGPSGAGKTALMSLLAGLLHPLAGHIEIGGVKLSSESSPLLRRRMAWMGQNPHVFSGSVEYNVSLGRSGVESAQVRQAINQAQLDAVKQAHPGNSLGEGGMGLSGGEAARLALARLAAAEHADLLLADEPTAHLDTETAGQVIKSLLSLAHGRTLIVTTHDPILAAHMDQVVHLQAPSDASSCIRRVA